MKPESQLAEQVLIARCQLRDRQALAELIERYERPVRYFIRRLVDNADLADELYQDTWLRVIRKIHTLANPERFTVWLYRIARNRVYEEFRRRRKQVELDEAMEAEAPDSTEDEIISFEDVAKVHRCLEKLKPIHKEVLLLKFLEEMSYEQIADVLDCNLGTVRSRIFHAKLALKKELEVSP
jgi:RNA polymerase sigma-70 factor (ECF subfamily)